MSANAAEEKLLHFQVQVDESHLIQHIQRTVQKALQVVRGDISELRHHTQRLLEDVEGMKKDMFTLKTVSLRRMLDILLDVRSAVVSNSMGAKAYKMAEDARTKEDDEHGYRDLEERIANLVSGDGDDNVCLDSERIDALEVQFGELEGRLVQLSESTMPDLFQRVSDRFDGDEGVVQQLFHFLGLSHRTMSPLLSTGGGDAAVVLVSDVQHTEQSIAMSQYFKRATDNAGQLEGRLAAAEAMLHQKINKQELELVNFAITDLRGTCDVTRNALETERREREEKLAATARGLQQEVDLRVSWTALEQWKLVVNEALLKTKESTKKTKTEVDELRVDSSGLKQELQELEIKLANLLLQPHHTEGGGGAPLASARQPHHGSQAAAAGHSTPAASRRLDSALSAAAASSTNSGPPPHSTPEGAPSPFSTAALQAALTQSMGSGLHDATKKSPLSFANYAGLGRAVNGTSTDVETHRQQQQQQQQQQRPRSALLLRRTM